MTPFDIAFQMVLGNEGSYVNNPHDPGGETNWGITIAVARENGYHGEMKAMTQADAKPIYRKRYWDVVQGDTLPARIACQLFDGAVNSGTHAAVEWLQKAVELPVTGRMNSSVALAAHKLPELAVVMRFDAYRLMYMAQARAWPHFGKGWANRIANQLLLATK